MSPLNFLSTKSLFNLRHLDKFGDLILRKFKGGDLSRTPCIFRRCISTSTCIDVLSTSGSHWELGVGETSFLKTRRFEASFRREMGNDTEFEASFRREMGNDTNSRRVFSEKRETIRYKMHHFSTKNKKNRGKTGKTGEKTLKNKKKQGKNWKKQWKKH